LVRGDARQLTALRSGIVGKQTLSALLHYQREVRGVFGSSRAAR
jgi:hypothetical protein